MTTAAPCHQKIARQLDRRKRAALQKLHGHSKMNAVPVGL
jgi:hypothetical protein